MLKKTVKKILLSLMILFFHDQVYSLDILEAFKFEKEGEKDKFNNRIGNKMLLWHGSRLSNFVGILS